MDIRDRRIGFVGAGRMATALAKGWINANLLSPDQILASDPFAPAREQFEKVTGSAAKAESLEVISQSDVLFLAVKPQIMDEVLTAIQEEVKPEHLVVSIAAGVTLDRLQSGLREQRRLIRVMPNTPCLVGASASGYCPTPGATENDIQLVDDLLNAVGKAFRLPERLLDAVTGLSGSGPAFVAILIEAMADGGVRMGLPREVALPLAAQTVLGTARMVLEESLHPAALKDMVTSPGGTTIAGLHELERSGARAAMMDAIEAATQRSIQLGQG